MDRERAIIRRVVEQYALTGTANDRDVRVKLLPNNKTSFVEATSDGGRGILLDEYRLDGRVIWAAYSTRTQTVYLSEATRA